MQMEQSLIPQYIVLLLFFRSKITLRMLPVFNNASIAIFVISTLLCGTFASAEELERPHNYSESQSVAMPTMPDGRLGRILRQYYDSSLGGRSGWDQLSSLQLEGRFSSQGEVLNFTAYLKKPDLFKLILKSDERKTIYGYDGDRAWVHWLRPASAPQRLKLADEAQFVSNALFGCHLLYPYAEGKVIRYVDTIPFEGRVCDLLQVELSNGHRFDYYLDLRTHLEVRRISFAPKSGDRLTFDLMDYDASGLIPIPRAVVLQRNEQQVGRFELGRLQFNPGIMPWMFRQPQL